MNQNVSIAPKDYDLSYVRRLEAVSFRSWPATHTEYDATWAVRLSDKHMAKRVNSVNPLDPSDRFGLEKRIARMAQRFKAFGRPLVFRLTPLAPVMLKDLLVQKGAYAFDETCVMMLDLYHYDYSNVVQQLPLQNRQHWMRQCMAMQSISALEKQGVDQLIGLIRGEVGLFLSEDQQGRPLAAVMAVHFADMLGIFELVTNAQNRGQGHGRRILQAALNWGRNHGAKTAWLQVMKDNQIAVDLYQSEGFKGVYEYHYHQFPAGA